MGAGGGGPGEPPPEQELEETFREPVVSGRWVWTANPETGRVALIDTETLTITTGEAELEPTYLAALASLSAEESAALVVNVGTSTVSLLRGSSGVVTSESADVHHGANALAVAPSSRVALVWTNAASVQNPDPTEGFQDVTVVSLGEPDQAPTSQRLTVGYRPSRVFFDETETRAFVVAEATVSVIELADEPRVLRDVPLGADPGEAASSRDATVTPDGKFALVRHENSPEVDVIDLTSGMKTRVLLPGNVTDLDLSPDASMAIAVVRGQADQVPSDPGGAGGEAGGGQEGGAAGDVGAGGSAGEGGGGGAANSDPPSGASLLVVLPLPDITSSPADFDAIAIDDVVGSVAIAESGDVAVLYTNATESDHLVIVSMQGSPDAWQYRTVLVKAPVKAVFPASDGEHAIAFLGQAVGSSLPGGYSIVPLAAKLPPKIVGTTSPPVGIAIAPAPSRSALVTLSHETTGNAVHVIRMPELSSDVVTLPSVPLAAGIVPETNMGFVAQRHAEGRITFVDLSSGAPRTVTGFELAEKVHDGTE